MTDITNLKKELSPLEERVFLTNNLDKDKKLKKVCKTIQSLELF